MSDVIHEAIQSRINEFVGGSAIVTHYVTIIGLHYVGEAGAVSAGALVATPEGQARYITNGLLEEAGILLSSPCDECEEIPDE